jgi:hypothetical protein
MLVTLTGSTASNNSWWLLDVLGTWPNPKYLEDSIEVGELYNKCRSSCSWAAICLRPSLVALWSIFKVIDIVLVNWSRVGMKYCNQHCFSLEIDLWLEIDTPWV